MKAVRLVFFAFVITSINCYLSASENPFYEDLQRQLEEDSKTVTDERILFQDLYLLKNLIRHLPDLEAIDPTFRRIEENQDISPLLRSEASFIRALYCLSRGRIDEAESIKNRLGFITEWYIIGPFDNENKTGYAASYAPEEGLLPGETCPGILRPVSWRYTRCISIKVRA